MIVEYPMSLSSPELTRTAPKGSRRLRVATPAVGYGAAILGSVAVWVGLFRLFAG